MFTAIVIASMKCATSPALYAMAATCTFATTCRTSATTSPTAWPDNGEIRHDFYRLAKPETMSAPQWHFASPTRAVEELYDCQADPQNLNDLTKSGKHREILNRLRAEHVRHITATADLGFLPESEAWELFSKQTGWELGQAGRVPLAGIHQAAAQVGVASERVFLKNLDSDNPTIRYWGAIGLGCEAGNLQTWPSANYDEKSVIHHRQHGLRSPTPLRLTATFRTHCRH